MGKKTLDDLAGFTENVLGPFGSGLTGYYGTKFLNDRLLSTSSKFVQQLNKPLPYGKPFIVGKNKPFVIGFSEGSIAEIGAIAVGAAAAYASYTYGKHIEEREANPPHSTVEAADIRHDGPIVESISHTR